MVDTAGDHRDGLLYQVHIDLPLLALLLLLASVGLVVLYSAGGEDVMVRQALRLALAFGIMAVVAQIPPDNLARWAPWLFAVGVGLLASVLILGEISKGAQRWLDLGVVRFQPSEMMKLAVPMMVAWFLADHPLPPSISRLAAALLLVVVPAGLIAKQPDLGTALLVGTSGIFVLLFAGMPWRYVFVFLLLLVPATAMIWQFGLHDYQRQRIHTFLDPESDPLGTGYHIIQSKIAVGSGGIYGKGWLNGTQSHLEFLPERHTDFIFAVLGEEFGLFGAVLLLSICLLIVLRGLVIAVQAQDTFSRLLAGTLTMTFLVYVFVNIGMVIGLLPVVGVPLPLISYGGSSMVTLLASFGILMSIQTHRKLLKG